VKKKAGKSRMKNANGEEKSASRAKRNKTPAVEAAIKEQQRINFSFSDEKEVIGIADMHLKNNLVQLAQMAENT
jgi:ethanolamine ammonia-lyase small subunit